MIKFEDFEGKYCPVFTCDYCLQPIQGLKTGLIQWDNYDQPTFTTLHKGPDMPCSRQWDWEHGRHEGKTVWVGWRPLEEFIAQLAYNTQHPFAMAH